ncbi:unnamed protein product [Streptomyces laurentii]|uniref:Uncharacterized protein n=1 Tax=Streptomyces laurentii TaxID=39478 RepID=A0A160P334_STRLU|nr:unnamed protein product [Streptomyces laurentii]
MRTCSFRREKTNHKANEEGGRKKGGGEEEAEIGRGNRGSAGAKRGSVGDQSGEATIAYP